MIRNPCVRLLDPIPIKTGDHPLVLLRDPYHFVDDALTVSVPVYLLLTLMDGSRTVFEIQRDFRGKYGGRVAAADLERLVEEFDEHGLLVSPRFEALRERVLREFAESPVRPASHAGSAYEKNPDALRDQLDAFFRSAAERGKGDAKERPFKNGCPRALIAPHIDPRVGGRCAAAAFARLKDAVAPPDLFVIFGTAHQPGRSLFILTEKTFQTPLGSVEVDRAVAAALIRDCPFDLKLDEYLHRHEHSIEFQLIFLQHLYGAGHPFRILPILVGSFHPFLESNTIPSTVEAVEAFTSALRKALRGCGRRYCLIAGADLSHIGMKFGDTEELSDALIENARRKDLEMLSHLQDGRHEDFFRYLQCDGDKQKVCGLPPIYTMLHSLDEPYRAELLDHQISVENQTQSFVSFAAMACYGAE